MIIGPRVHYGPRAKALGPLCTLRADYHVPARLSRVLTSIYVPFPGTVTVYQTCIYVDNILFVFHGTC